MSVGLIWAQSTNGVLGSNGTIPWYLPEDLSRFRQKTAGAAVIMGRRTWDSLPARFRPLPGRRNIVLTRQDDWRAEGADVTDSLAAALAMVPSGPRWVIGGGEIYRVAIEWATQVHVTHVAGTFRGDAHAPSLDTGWQLTEVEPSTGWLNSSTGLRYRYCEYTRT
ncbi:dihydrofolate reductase [Actinokineospora cianjurensis]|uniref:Dihydrofolate reductase n=1 Tax=Actinokineospora cianjurensis TaxID=585224 RepID=A0A421BBY5_9PSEU|nr:dihydrofolate reductase [Actinokineospora cianjurensis]RLK61858.1 dihydrofolate reductase [Actinokineospora cianjurensis]